VVQHEPDDIPFVEAIPLAEEPPPVDDIPVVEQGIVGTDVLGVRTAGGGLSPPAPSSVEPIGIPTRPTDGAEPIPAGEEAEAAGPAKELPAIPAQVPDAVPTVPPPSKSAVDPDVPPVDIPVPKDVPAMELPTPEDVELPTPKDA